MEDGFNLVGECLGTRTEPWRDNSGRVNHRLGIARKYEDSWGKECVDVTEVDIPLDSFEKIEKQAAMLAGKKVIVRVVPMAKTGGKKGAWLSVFIPRGASILPAPVKAKVSEAAA